eukprot:scaffold32797_cov22-Tisochrysis_lutea.AAC.2
MTWPNRGTRSIKRSDAAHRSAPSLTKVEKKYKEGQLSSTLFTSHANESAKLAIQKVLPHGEMPTYPKNPSEAVSSGFTSTFQKLSRGCVDETIQQRRSQYAAFMYVSMDDF